MRGLIVTGTDTGAGKTLVSAALLLVSGGIYWKPLQTGTAAGDDDTVTVKRLTGLPAAHFLQPACAFKAPLSPDEAARQEGTIIDQRRLHLPVLSAPLIVEGAGGALVPVNETILLADLFARWALPVVVVVRGRLGMINHTLLTVEALRARSLSMAGLVISGDAPPGSTDSIRRHSGVETVITLAEDARANTPEGVGRWSPQLAPLWAGLS